MELNDNNIVIIIIITKPNVRCLERIAPCQGARIPLFDVLIYKTVSYDVQ